MPIQFAKPAGERKSPAMIKATQSPPTHFRNIGRWRNNLDANHKGKRYRTQKASPTGVDRSTKKIAATRPSVAVAIRYGQT
jgi:hypothetical protein